MQYIYSGGTATGAIVSGGNSDQQAYGAAISTTVLADGALFVGAKGSSFNAVIGNGGEEFVASGGSAIGTTISGSGVTEAVDGGVLGSGTSLTFAGTGGTLQVDDTTMPTAVISGSAPGDTLAFTGLGQILPPSAGLTDVTLLSGNALQLTTQDIFFQTAKYFLQLDPLQNFNGKQFEVEIGTDPLGFPGSVEIFVSGPSGPVVSGGTTFVSGGSTITGAVVERRRTCRPLRRHRARYDDRQRRLGSRPRRRRRPCRAGRRRRTGRVRHGKRGDGVRRIAGGRIPAASRATRRSRMAARSTSRAAASPTRR